MISQHRTPPTDSDRRKLYLRGGRDKALNIEGGTIQDVLKRAMKAPPPEPVIKKTIAVVPPDQIPQKTKKKSKRGQRNTLPADGQVRKPAASKPIRRTKGSLHFADPGPLRRPQAIVAPEERKGPAKQQTKNQRGNAIKANSGNRPTKGPLGEAVKKKSKKGFFPDEYDGPRKWEAGYRIVQGGLPELGRRR